MPDVPARVLRRCRCGATRGPHLKAEAARVHQGFHIVDERHSPDSRDLVRWHARHNGRDHMELALDPAAAGPDLGHVCGHCNVGDEHPAIGPHPSRGPGLLESDQHHIVVLRSSRHELTIGDRTPITLRCRRNLPRERGQRMWHRGSIERIATRNENGTCCQQENADECGWELPCLDPPKDSARQRPPWEAQVRMRGQEAAATEDDRGKKRRDGVRCPIKAHYPIVRGARASRSLDYEDMAKTPSSRSSVIRSAFSARSPHPPEWNTGASSTTDAA